MICVLTKQHHFALVKSELPHAVAGDSLDLLRSGGDVLLCFGTGIIVPEYSLSRFRLRYNFHAAPPAYPGRDPHHWAAYDRAASYGATAHEMEKAVDSGAIVALMTMGAGPNWSAEDYRNAGLRAAIALFQAVAHQCVSGLPALPVSWSGRKHSRADLLKMCDMRDLDITEITRRKHAFAGFEQHFRLSP
jgi:methionyl-tRNA formyltransferase